MKIPFQCFQCGPDTRTWALVEISGSGVHTGVCSAGHDVRFRLAFECAHELLLDVAALALLDGYYREAVSSFAAALEQSFEFYVEASMIASGLERNDVRKLLRENRTDQRRIGMVTACYLRDTRKEFPYLKDKMTKFRNRVLHNVYWPTRPETIAFAQHVCWSVSGLHRDLGSKKVTLLGLLQDDATLADAEDLLAGRKAPASLAARPSLLLEKNAATDLEGALASFASRNWWSVARKLTGE